MSELKIYGHDPIVTAWGSPTPQREPKLKVTVNWSTRIVESPRSGAEYRTPLITEPRYEIEGSDFVLTDESYATLSQAFRDTKGRALAFPFKNPIDYYCTEDPEILAEDTTQRGFIVPTGEGKGVLVKQFFCKGVSAYKTQLFPIEDSLSIEGITIESDGTLSGVAGSEWIPCGAEYRQLYRFDVSDLQLTQIKRALDEFDVNVYQAVNFRLVEDSYNKVPGLIYSVDWDVNIGFDLLNLPHADITYSDRIVSRIEQSISQKEAREDVDVTEKRIILESGNLDWLNTQVFLTIFNSCKGRLNAFNFGSSKAWFDSDILGIEQLGVNAFSVDGLSLKSIECEPFILEETSSFNFDLGSPPDGDYPRTVLAPQAVLDYLNSPCGSVGTVYAYLLSATVDNGFRSVQFPEVEIDTIGSVSYEPDGVLFGIGTAIDVLIYQRALGPCYFYGTVRWEVM